MSKHKDNLTERIQVLLSKEDVSELHVMICETAIHENKKPETLSKYLRTKIKEIIEDYKNKNKLC